MKKTLSKFSIQESKLVKLQSLSMQFLKTQEIKNHTLVAMMLKKLGGDNDDDSATPNIFQKPFTSGRTSIFSIFSGVSVMSFSHNNTYSFVNSFIIILLFGFIIGAITYKLFFCALIQQ